MRRAITRSFAVAAAIVACAALPAAPAGATQAPKHPIDLDVLFIGAHPDDEAFALSTYGQWAERHDVRTGVITVTRGEGGGNAVGPQEGPPLGLLREDEERRAVGRAGIRNIFNLDRVDFYYTVSEPLTAQVWDHEATLERVVRIVRETRPEVITTMNPAPSPSNHGNHQEAARYAVEAFRLAADPTAFPDQIRKEGLRPWRVKRIFRGGADGAQRVGPDCAATFQPTDPSDQVFGVWAGVQSTANPGRTWAQIERDGQRQYASQGWAVFPDVPTDPNQIGCDFFTQVDSRVPYTIDSASGDAPLEGAVLPTDGLPLGTELYLTTDRFDVTPGQRFEVTAHVRGPHKLKDAKVALRLPTGWRGERTASLGRLSPDRESTATFRVTPPAGAAAETRERLRATLSSRGRSGETAEVVRVAPAVRGTVQPLAQVAQFREWATGVAGQPQLDNLVKPRLSIGLGESRSVRVDLRNLSASTQSGSVTLDLPAGFTATPSTQPYAGLAPGDTTSVTFTVANTDTSLKTSNEGPNGGDYDGKVVTTAGGSSSSQTWALNLVPVTTVQQAAAAPSVDGSESAGEYPGAPIDLSRKWEGSDPDSPADASGWAKLAWSADALYMFVHVTDDTLGTVLPASDAKRHWRTDSVEIAIDPRADSENTSTTFKVGVFPTTQEGGPAAYRDADNHQGPIAETAPGMQIASKVSDPYTGYDIEVKIPFSELPAAARPDGTGLNVFIYDSDTQDKTGQTRLGWSTWGGVQGDPYRWGHAILDGYTPPAGQPTTPADPVFPRDAAQSTSSGQTILQSSWDGVPIAGGPGLGRRALRILGPATLSGDTMTVVVRAQRAGTAYVHAADAAGHSLGMRAVQVGAGRTSIPVTVTGDPAEVAKALVAFEAGGATVSVAAPVTSEG